MAFLESSCVRTALHMRMMYFDLMLRSNFARRFQMTLQGAADYLCKFKGIRFLDDCYPSEHLLPVEDALDDLVAVCKRNFDFSLEISILWQGRKRL